MFPPALQLRSPSQHCWHTRTHAVPVPCVLAVYLCCADEEDVEGAESREHKRWIERWAFEMRCSLAVVAYYTCSVIVQAVCRDAALLIILCSTSVRDPASHPR